MKTGEARYFLALIPKEPLATELMQIKEEFPEKYKSKAGLRSPAHLTLHMPFLWKERNEDRLIKLLDQATSQEPFELVLNGFGAFPPRTIFVKNEESEALRAFHSDLVKHCRLVLKLLNSTHNRGFHPHITVAFRDLKKERFAEAWSAFEHRPFAAKMPVNSFWLLKHDGKKWHAHKEFVFKPRD